MSNSEPFQPGDPGTANQESVPRYGQDPYPQGPYQSGTYPQNPYGSAPYQQGPYQYAPGYGQQFVPPALPNPFASWGSRVSARLIDTLASAVPMALLITIGAVVAFQNSHEVTRPDGTTDTVGINGVGVALIGLGIASSILFSFWNLGLRQGKTGQSIGKKLLHIMVIDEQTGRPAGTGAGAGRFGIEFGIGCVSSCVGFLSLLDFLWPLWDNKNQSLHDKVVHTVVINEPSPARQA